MKKLLSFILFLLIFACSQQEEILVPTTQQIENAIASGSFGRAEVLIKEYMHAHSLPYREQQKWLFQIEKMNRIRKDFMATDSLVLSFLHNYYDSISPQQIRIWEEGKALEYMIIDGKKHYFNHAARNLFRISLTARRQWEKFHGNRPDSLARFLSHYLPNVVKDVPAKQNTIVDPVNMEVTYTLTVKPNAVPAGELVRAWMPFPRTDIPRQTDVHLISTSPANYVVSPDRYAHKTLYMEKRAVMDQPTQFSYIFSYTSHAQWFDFSPEDIRLYDTQSDIYFDFTKEQPPHIVFSDRIKERTREVVGNEQNPYLKARKIYDWINRNFPWASAREYSTIDNIPEYVLDNHHGDCGEVSLLFITMARCAGIPAKWQSGFMMHPGNKNLHDWAEVFFEGVGWVPVDQSFGRQKLSQNPNVYWFYTKGIDAFRMIVNQDIGRELFPLKVHPRSETVDFQRGEVEWRGGNLYFDQWHYNMDISYNPVSTTTVSEGPQSGKKESGTTYQSLPFTNWGSPGGAADMYLGGGIYAYPSGSMPSPYQLYGSDAEMVIRLNNQRSYLKGEQLRNTRPYEYPANTAPAYDSYRYEYDLPYNSQYNSQYNTPYNFPYDSFRNSSYPPSRYQDNSVSSEYFPYLDRYNTDDRYVPPSERNQIPRSGNYLPPYRRDLRDRYVGDPLITLPAPTETQRIQGTIPVTPYTDYGVRR